MVKDKLLTTKNPVVFTSLPPSTLPSSDKSSTTSTVTVTLSPAKQPTTTTTAPKSSPQVSDSIQSPRLLSIVFLYRVVCGEKFCRYIKHVWPTGSFHCLVF